jgi:cytochrome P450
VPQNASTHEERAQHEVIAPARHSTWSARWEPLVKRREALDIYQEMLRLTLNIIGKTMLSTEVEVTSMEMLRAYGDASEFINCRLASFIDLPLFLPTPFNRRFTAAIRTLDRLIYQIIAQHQQQADGPRDLLSKLLAARDENMGAGMSRQQLRDEVITIFFAGHETSAVALTWAWYLLAQHPEVEQTLHAELDTVPGGRTPTRDDLPRLSYTRIVMEGTMRLYPPVWTFLRVAIEADEIGGYHIPAGSLIFPCQYLTHRHPDFWDQPV